MKQIKSVLSKSERLQTPSERFIQSKRLSASIYTVITPRKQVLYLQVNVLTKCSYDGLAKDV